jgi:hypothetical protein
MLPFLLLILPDQDRAEPSFGSMHAMRDRSAAADPRIRRKYLDISIRHGCAAVSVPAWRLSHTDGPPRGFPESGDLRPYSRAFAGLAAIALAPEPYPCSLES